MSLHSGEAVLTKRLTNFRIDEELLGGLQAIREREGIPVSEQVRRAIQAWLALKGGATKTKTRRPRRRSRKRG
jgi:Ribbon-helix-helix protein, copG family